MDRLELWLQVCVASSAAGGRNWTWFLLSLSWRNCWRQTSPQHRGRTWNSVWNKAFLNRKIALWPWWQVAASSQIHLHRFLVGGLCNLLLDTGIVCTAVYISPCCEYCTGSAYNCWRFTNTCGHAFDLPCLQDIFMCILYWSYFYAILKVPNGVI